MNADEARSMLKILSGKEHEVITGYSILNPSGEIACTHHESTIVTIKTLSAKEIDSYIGSGEPFRKGRKLCHPGDRVLHGGGDKGLI